MVLTMKLQAEYNNVKAKVSKLDVAKVMKYKADLINSGECKDVNVRIAWELLRGTVGTTEICKWYDRYACTDKHIETLALKVCKDLSLLIDIDTGIPVAKCPFCGNKAALKSKCNYVETGGNTMHYVECSQCFSQCQWQSLEDKALKLWNTRTTV
jgi:hypothetical protein